MLQQLVLSTNTQLLFSDKNSSLSCVCVPLLQHWILLDQGNLYIAQTLMYEIYLWKYSERDVVSSFHLV